METSKLSLSGKIQRSMRSHPLFYYFILAFAFSWILTIPYMLSTWNLLPGDYTLVLYLKQWAGPALAAIIMTRVVDGKLGLSRLRTGIRHWRVGWPWYVFILLGVPVLALIGVILQPGAFANFKGFQPGLLTNYLFYFIGIFFATGLPEEIGWRGFALPRLQQRFTPLISSLMLGSLWGLWHLIWFFLPTHGGGPGISLSAMLMNFIVFFMMVVALTIIFTWSFNGTQGSLLIASLLHTAIDAPQMVWIPLFLDVGATNTSAGEMGLNLAYLIVFGVVAMIILIFSRGRLGFPQRPNPIRDPLSNKIRHVLSDQGNK
jgi:membrane protease YdiL (CAAX protease family)